MEIKNMYEKYGDLIHFIFKAIMCKICAYGTLVV